MILEEEDYYLSHYGVIRRSGRYPWGSGEEENTHNKQFLQYVSELRKNGVPEKAIWEGMDLTSTEYRRQLSNARAQQKQANIAQAMRFQDKGMSVNAIATRMNEAEATVRSWLKPGALDKAFATKNTAEAIAKEVDAANKKGDGLGIIDVSKGAERFLKVTRTKFNNALALLHDWGYELYTVPLPQLGTDKDTRMKVACPPGTTWAQANRAKFSVRQISSKSTDHGRTFTPIHDPISIDPKRVGVVYGPDGGADADGVIFARRGMPDLNLGGKNYGQVRIQVGDGHYLKGMAILKDDMPPGPDLLFHTAKRSTGNKLDAMKPLSKDLSLPFEAIVDQIVDKPGSPDAKVTSVMNLVNVEGDWDKWSRTLSTQFLSKQNPVLAKSQLDMTYERRQSEFDEIKSLTNPTVRKKLLYDFADSTEAAMVHMKAANLPNQRVAVLLPVPSLPATQVYAPQFRSGERVVLIRHPHGGTFEIPDLIVNNKHRDSKRLMGDAQDAIGINHRVAHRLSGADFDGDTVLVIPDPMGRIKITPALEKLKDFDPHLMYPGTPDMKRMKNTQTEMGKISNLITDMTIQNAPVDHIARAVKHSMVVIDAEKHGLNYRLSYSDNGIKELKEKYQGSAMGGAASLFSRTKSQQNVPHRRERRQSEGGAFDPVTGKRMFVETGKTWYPSGKPRETKSKKMLEAESAFELVSGTTGTPMERMYAAYSDKLRAMSYQARLAYLNTPRAETSTTAKKTYAAQVDSLTAKLRLAEENAPYERQAQAIANSVVKAKRDANPNLDKSTIKKLKAQELNIARSRMGAKKTDIKISDDEWEAIQAGAISDSRLVDILKHADMEEVRKLATPRTQKMMTPTMTNRAKIMLDQGYPRGEVAAALGVSLTTLDTATNG